MFDSVINLNPGTEPRTLRSKSFEAIADYIKSGDVKRITVLTGAGISTAAGIPDFRSPGTGLYANLERLKLPYAEAVFDISYFRSHPEPFYYLAKELYPGKFHPTVSHAFIALLAKKGLLHMNFTQNIDCLERRAGVPEDKIIEAHGSFATQRCIDCSSPYPGDRMRKHVEEEVVPRCDDCGGLVKPDIVFFGEALPGAFRDNAHLPARSDLVMVIGTSLTVYPFAGLPEMVPSTVPRLLLNKEQVGQIGNRPDDVVELGSCDSGTRKLADMLGWRDELEALWRSITGEQEAERQISAEHCEPEVEEEIRRVTVALDGGLKLGGTRESDSLDEKQHDECFAGTHPNSSLPHRQSKNETTGPIEADRMAEPSSSPAKSGGPNKAAPTRQVEEASIEGDETRPMGLSTSDMSNGDSPASMSGESAAADYAGTKEPPCPASLSVRAGPVAAVEPFEIQGNKASKGAKGKD